VELKKKNIILIVLLGILAISLNAVAQNSDFELFKKGERDKFYTKDHPKAKGINISIEYPKSWIASEGERPNVVQKFSADASDGITRGCMILIKDMPKVLSLMPDGDIAKEVFAEQALPEIIPPGGSFINGQSTKYDGQEGAWMIYSMEMDRAGIKMKMYTLQQMFIYSGKLINVQSTVGGLVYTDNNLYAIFTGYLPLFQQIGNSIVIHDKWNKDANSKDTSAMEVAFGDYWWLTLIVSALLTWGLGLIPPVIIRYLIVRKPLSKPWAIGVVVFLWMVNIVIFTALGSQSKTHTALFLVAWVSYVILRKGKTTKKKQKDIL